MQPTCILIIIAICGKSSAADAPFLSSLQVPTDRPELETKTESVPFVSADVLAANAPAYENPSPRPMTPSAASAPRVPEPEIKLVDAPSKPQITGMYPPALPLPGPYPEAEGAPTKQPIANITSKVKPVIVQNNDMQVPKMQVLLQSGIYPPAVLPLTETGTFPEDSNEQE